MSTREIGYNYRMSNLLAAVGTRPVGVARRSNHSCDVRITQYYAAGLRDVPGISFMPEPAECCSTRWLTCILVDPDQFGGTREDIRLALERNNIESRPVWKPMHMQVAFSACRMLGGKVSELLFANGLCLPSGSNLSDNDRTAWWRQFGPCADLSAHSVSSNERAWRRSAFTARGVE